MSPRLESKQYHSPYQLNRRHSQRDPDRLQHLVSYLKPTLTRYFWHLTIHVSTYPLRKVCGREYRYLVTWLRLVLLVNKW